MKKLFFLLILLAVNFVYSQGCYNFDWVKGSGSSGIDQANNIATDSAGYSYVTGKFQGIVSFGSISLISSGSAGNSDAFIAKVDPNGNYVWAIKAGGTNHDLGNGITIDKQGNIYVIGEFSGAISIGGSALTSSGQSDVFIAKFNNQGQIIWAKGVGGTGVDSGIGIAVDDLSNVYVTGYFSGSSNFGVTTLNSYGNSDIFITKLTSAGQFSWTVQAGSTNNDYGYDIVVDNFGNSYVTGWFSGVAAFGSQLLTSNGFDDAFVSKINSSGQFVWANQIGGSSFDDGRSISLDANSNVYVTGKFYGTVTVGNHIMNSVGQSDVFIVKMNSSGIFDWATGFGGSQNDQAYDLLFDSSGYAFVSGRFNSTSVSVNGFQYVGPGYFIGKIDNLGNFIWIRNSFAPAYKISVDYVNNCYLVGGFNNSVDFGIQTLTTNGDSDIFIGALKISGGALTVAPISVINDTINCGQSVQLNSNVLNYDSFTWNNINTLNDNTIFNPIATPLQTTTYTLSAEACGSVVSQSIIITVVPLTVNVTSVPNPAQCGDQVQLTANLVGGSNVNYSWTYSSSLSATNISNPIASLNIAAPHVYSVIATTSNGCSASGSVTIPVTQIPGFVLAASANPNPLECGNSVTLTSSVQGSFSNLLYNWTRGGQSIATTQNHTLIPLQNSVYTIKVTHPTGCYIATTVAVTVNPPNGFVVTPTASDTLIVCGNSSTLTATSVGGVGAVTYQWLNQVGNVISNQQSFTVNPQQTTTYTIKATNSNGCSVSNQITIHVQPPNGYNVYANANTMTIECGSSVNLSATLQTPGNQVTYQWLANGQTIANTASTTVSPRTTTTYTINATNVGGCVATDQITITVLNSNPQTLTINGGSFACTNGTTLSVPSNFANNLQWSTGQTTSSISVNQPGTYTVSGNLISGPFQGCVAQGTKVLDTLAKILVPSGSLLCQGVTGVELKAIPHSSVTNATYFWNTGATSQAITVNTGGTYMCNVSSSGCSYTVQTSVNILPTVVNPTMFTNSTNNLSVTFTNNEPLAITYSWTFGDGSTSIQQNPTHVYSQSGIYNVCLTVTDSCGNSGTICKNVNVGNLSIDEIDTSTIKIYPNPVENILNVELLVDNGFIRIFDVSGKVIYSKTILSNKEILNVSDLSNGVYYLHFMNNNFSKVDRFIVER